MSLTVLTLRFRYQSRVQAAFGGMLAVTPGATTASLVGEPGHLRSDQRNAKLLGSGTAWWADHCCASALMRIMVVK
jgi:hypothetical protein